MKNLKIGLFALVLAIGLFLVAAGSANRDTFAYATQAPMFALIAATMASIRLLSVRISDFFEKTLAVLTAASGFLAAWYWLLSEDASVLILGLALFLAVASGTCLYIRGSQSEESKKD